MDDPIIIDITVQGIMLVLLLTLPPIALATLAGVGVSLLQALTQVQEQTLGFAVKMSVVTIAILFTAQYMSAELFNYTNYIFTNFPSMLK